MNIRVAIADRDEVYLERLGDGLQKNSDIICTRYSEPGAFFHALKNRKVDVVLFDTSILEGVEWSSLDFSGVTVPAVLYHEETETKDLPTGIEKVMKYQRVSGIYRSIVDLFASKGRKGLESGQSSTVIAVFSPAGGTGKSTVAFKLAGQLAAAGRRSLYISVEDVPGAEAFVAAGGAGGMDELYSFVMDEKGDVGLKLEACAAELSPGLSYLAPFGNLMDANDTSAQNLSELLEKVAGTGRFSCVVVDMSTGLSEKNRMILTQADHVVLVEKPDPCTQAKMRRFLGQYNLMEDYGPKMVRVQNFDIGKAQLYSDCPYPVIGRIPFAGTMGEENMLSFAGRLPDLDISSFL